MNFEAGNDIDGHSNLRFYITVNRLSCTQFTLRPSRLASGKLNKKFLIGGSGLKHTRLIFILA